jgi:hypothetical protein
MSVAAAHGSTPEQTVAAKAAVRDTHLAGIVDEAKRRAAARHFTHSLMSHGSHHHTPRK